MDKVDFEFKINDKAYNEPFAKQLLTELYDKGLVHSSNKDKPDIWNNSQSYGIEITTLTDTYRNTLNRYKRVWAKRNMNLEQIVKNQPTLLQGKLGINKYGNLILLNATGGKRSISKSQKSIATTVEMKLRKLQTYKIFNRNDLFIFAPNLHVGCTPQKVQQAISSIETLTRIDLSSFNHKYNNIIVYTYNEMIIVPFKDVGVLRIINVPASIRDSCDKVATLEAEKVNAAKELKKSRKNSLRLEQLNNELEKE